jgi:PAS domain S-box-containing protein
MPRTAVVRYISNRTLPPGNQVYRQVFDSNRSEKLSSIGVITAMCLGLYLSSHYSYLLFHGLIEITTIAIAFTIFILTWNTRRFLANNYLSILGIGYAFIALMDLFHALAYKGMNVFPGFGANLPTQLWIAARFLQAVTLCIAPLFMERRVRHRATFGIYAAVTSLLVAMIYSGYFPDCYIEGKGLTTFKISSEYLMAALFLISSYLLYRKRNHFDGTVFLLLLAATVCSAFSGIMFTTYVNVYDKANLAGHFLKLAAFYLVYRALLVKGFQEPFALIFRDLKQTEAALLKAHDTLEEKVRARTAALHESEQRLRQAQEFIEQIINSVPDPILVKDRQHRFVLVNDALCSFTGHAREQLIGKSDHDFFPKEEADEYCSKDELVFNSNQPNLNEETLTDTAGSRHYIQTRKASFATSDGREFLIGVIRDITGLKRTEKAMYRLNRELRAISNCNHILIRAECEQTLLNDVCRIVCHEAGYHMAWVGYARSDDAKTVCPVAWAGFDNGYIANLKLTLPDDAEGCQGPTAKAFRNGEPVYVHDIATDPHMIPWREMALQHGYRSSIALPLKDASAHTFGVLNIYSPESNAFTADETRLLEELSDNLAFGIMVLRDRTERKRAEERLQESEQRLRLTLEAAQIGIWDWDVTNDRWYASPTYYTMLGYEPKTGPGDRAEWMERLHPDDRALFTRKMHDVTSRHFREYEYEARMWHADGTYRWQHVKGFGIERDQDGKVARMLGVRIDITERKQAEQERLAHLKFLEHMDRVNQVIQGANGLEQMMSDVLGAVLSIFGCDRAFLMYPCDPESVAWSVPMERTRPKYSGAGVGCEMPMTPFVAESFRILLASDGPVQFGPGTGNPLPPDVSECFNFKSFMSMALHPKTGKPWQFGIHHCSSPMVWSAGEEKLLQEIGRRLADGLTSMLTYRDLQENERRLALIKYALDNTQESAYICNTPGQFIYVNDEACRLLGYSQDELYGMTVGDIVYDVPFGDWEQHIGDLMARGALTFEAGHTAKDSRRIPVELNVKYFKHNDTGYILALARDITERKLTEAMLHKREREFRTLAENSPDHIIRYDRERRVSYINPQLEKSLGVRAEEVIGTILRTAGDHFAEFRKTLEMVFETGKGAQLLVKLPDHGDGARYHLVRMVAELDQEGRIIGVLSIGSDITDQKQAEENLRRLNEELEERVGERTAELEQANARLQELDRMKSMFIASMSHELRTPLNSTIGFSRILLNEWAGPLNDEQKENLETILRSGKHLLTLVNDVIDVSRIEAGMIAACPADFDIHDLVSEAVLSFGNDVAAKGVELKLQVIHHTVHTDRTRLLQCLFNLISNAVKYMEQGTITICATVPDGSDMLEISVADTGIGIREEDLGKLFTPFVRLDSLRAPTVPGTGLGLYLTRKLVKEVLQGTITVQSTHGAGSRFVVTVPVSLQHSTESHLFDGAGIHA